MAPEPQPPGQADEEPRWEGPTHHAGQPQVAHHPTTKMTTRPPFGLQRPAVASHPRVETAPPWQPARATARSGPRPQTSAGSQGPTETSRLGQKP